MKTAKPASFQNPKGVSGIARNIDRMKQDTAISNKDNTCAKEEVDLKDVLGILEKHNGDRGGLIAILEEIQAEYGYLP